MIIKQYQDKEDDKVSADYARIYIYCLCDKCNDQITTLITRISDKIPDYDHVSNEKLARMIIGGIKRLDNHLVEHYIVRDAGIVINDKHYCKSCWNNTKPPDKTPSFQERIELLRKA